MLMVPENPYPTDSRAEKRIFDALNEVFYPHHAAFIGLHSFKLSQHAESAMYSLHQRLSQQLTRTLFNKIIFGYGVILPDCRLSAKSMEWD